METEIVVESPPAEQESPVEGLAEELAEAQLEVAHELQQEAEVEQAQETSEQALRAVSEHDHPQYAELSHEHGEAALYARMEALEACVQALEESMKEPEKEVEEIEPVSDPPIEPKRKHGMRFGRK